MSAPTPTSNQSLQYHRKYLIKCGNLQYTQQLSVKLSNKMEVITGKYYATGKGQ